MTDQQAQLAHRRDQLAKLESLRSVLGDQLTDQKKAELESQIQTLVDTGGGAIITGRIDTHGGDFAGRDKWQIILGDQYVGVSPDQVDPDVLLQAYLRALAAECSRLPLGVVDPRFLQLGAETPLPLSDVYIDLDVLAPVRTEQEKGKEGERAFLGRLTRGEGGERTALLEAIAHPQVTRFVLLGDPGSGKTTFANYLAYTLAADVPLDTPLQGLLPVRLILRDVAAHCILPDATRGQASMIWDALQADLAARLGENAAAVLFPHLQHRLLEQGGLLVLDGLDEVPQTARRRQCLLEAVADLAAALPPGRSRVVVTARPYAYADPRWRLREFETLILAPFNDEQVQRFVARWYQAVRPAMGWDEATAQARGDRLQEALADRPYLADLSTRPLLLTLMTTLHTSWGQLPQDRADLYEETVKLLQSRWQRAREVQDPDGETMIEPGIARVLAVDESRVREALHQLAYRVHQQQANAAERTDAPADIGEGDVLAAFAPLLPEDLNPRVVLEYLETRAGLLVGRAPGVYAFPHRSFQEYLAACHLADGPDFAAQLRQHVWSDPTWWREVFLLGAGKAKQGGLGNAVHVVNTLVPEGPADVAQASETHWLAALLAAQVLIDLRFPEAAEGKPDFNATLRRLRRWLVALLENTDTLAPRERAQAGDLLAKLGDPRPGVTVIVGAQDAVPLPDITWIEIPAGSFLMGSPEGEEDTYDDEHPQHTLELPTFHISRYPITNAQYRPFIASGGYDEPRHWPPDGWAWRTGEREPDLSPFTDEELRKQLTDWLAGRPVEKRDRPFWWGHSHFGLPNRPVVGVTWYEAVAYANWLTEQLQGGIHYELHVWRNGQLEILNPQPVTLTVRLPTEAEWEKAARGTEGRRYPWGNEWAAELANTKESGIGETSAVGAFPGGASPYGLLDMAGNVWEWTHSRWGRTSEYRPDYRYPYDPADGREELGGPDLRVLRGGSWLSASGDARCAYRFRNSPDLFDHGVGFRIVVSLVLGSSEF